MFLSGFRGDEDDEDEEEQEEALRPSGLWAMPPDHEAW